MEKVYEFTKLNPDNEEDIQAYVRFHKKLSEHLKSSTEPLTEQQIAWQIVRYKDGDEATFFCMLNGEVVGFINVCNYHVVDGKRPDDDIGLISDIFVDQNAQASDGGHVAFKLLQLGVDELLSNGKNRAIMVVQDDNKNKHLHFSLADKVLKTSEVERRDGRKTTQYMVLISDLTKIKDMSFRELMKRSSLLLRAVERQGKKLVPFCDL